MLRTRTIEHWHFAKAIDLSDKENRAYREDVANNRINITIGDRVASYTDFYEALDKLGVNNQDTRARLEKQFDYYFDKAEKIGDTISYNLFAYSCKDGADVPYYMFISTLTEPHKELGKYSLGVTHKVYTSGFHIVAGVEDYEYSKGDVSLTRHFSEKDNNTLNKTLKTNTRQLDPRFKDNNDPLGNEAGDFVISYSLLSKFMESSKQVNITSLGEERTVNDFSALDVLKVLGYSSGPNHKNSVDLDSDSPTE